MTTPPLCYIDILQAPSARTRYLSCHNSSNTLLWHRVMTLKRSNDILPSLLDALPSAIIPDDVDLASIASSFADSLGRLSASDFAKVAIWRDCFALTGTLRTFYSPRTVSEVYRNRCLARQAQSFRLQADEAHLVRISPSCSWIDVPFRFETNASPAAFCSGVLSLVPNGENSEYTIWMLRTLLDRLREYPSVDTLDPTAQIPSVGDSTTDFDCLIVGAGHSGLNVAGRLKALGVSYLVIDKNPCVGDNWRLRYDSAKCLFFRFLYGKVAYSKQYTRSATTPICLLNETLPISTMSI
jgi:hypothetical protein